MIILHFLNFNVFINYFNFQDFHLIIHFLEPIPVNINSINCLSFKFQDYNLMILPFKYFY